MLQTDFLAQRLVMKTALKKQIMYLLGPNRAQLDDLHRAKIKEAVQNTCESFIKPTRRRNVIETLAHDILIGLKLDDLMIRKDNKQ